MAVQMDGWKELGDALDQLPKATARNTLRRELRKAAAPVLAEMQSRAPVADEPYYRGKGERRRLVQPGRTKASLGISNTLNPANRKKQKKEGKSFAEVHVGSTQGSAAIFAEYGGFANPPRPYLGPAWEATKDDALRIFSEGLGTAIEKAAARYAKKLAKG